MAKRIRAGDLRRRPWRREPLRRFLVVCEGRLTEPEYFKALRRRYRASVKLVIEPGGVSPERLVERAVDMKRAAERDARRQRDRFLRYEEVWCVFDTDKHDHLADAHRQAEENGIDLAVSNPCFELWALLHFQEQTGFLESQAARARLKKHLPEYEKTLPFERLDPNYATAVTRARELDRRCGDDGSPGVNPSTGVYRLTERIRER